MYTIDVEPLQIDTEVEEVAHSVVIALDIDQTISSGFVGKSVQESIHYYQDRGIIIPQRATRYIDFFGLPDVVRIHEELPGALQGTRHLAAWGDIHYFTVRKGNGDQDSQIQVEQATYAWLAEHGFPNAQRVIFCQSMVQKLLKLAEIPAAASRIILVDDSWAKALQALKQLTDHSPETAMSAQRLRERLTLVAFGALTSDLPHEAVVPIVTLPLWSDIERLVSVLFKEDLYAISRNPTYPVPIRNANTILPQDISERTPESVLNAIQGWPYWIDIQRVALKEYHMEPDAFDRYLPEYQRFQGLVLLGNGPLPMLSREVDVV